MVVLGKNTDQVKKGDAKLKIGTVKDRDYIFTALW